MGEVIGPYDADDWYVMGELKKGIAFMRSYDYSRFESAIKKETTIYKDYLRRVA